jgi:hypothetical protein
VKIRCTTLLAGILTAVCLLALLAEPSEAGQVSLGIDSNDVLVFTGGAAMVAAQQNGDLELLMTLALGPKTPRFRSLAWEGDTVYEQPREMNFGSWRDQLRRVGATVVLAQFGQMESLQGQAGLAGFIQSYDQLLDQFCQQTSRIVMLSPAPFEKPQPPLPDLSLRNQNLRLYVLAIGELARKRNYRFVDVFTTFLDPKSRDEGFTVDGYQLGPGGHRAVAVETVRQLGLGKMPKLLLDPRSVSAPGSISDLRSLILAKNQLWFDYWRPMNWAFLHGDRTEQPSSRDHRDPRVRWFPEELEKFLPLIEAKETAIARSSTEMGLEKAR